jgi:hypothetical protein
MPADTFDYAIVRIVPRVEREEFMNAGVILFSRTRRFLEARIALDEARLQAFAPGIDLRELREHLEAIPRICVGGSDAGPIGALPQPERFRWLVAPRSTVIQCSPVHSGRTDDPEREIGHLLETLVHVPSAADRDRAG